LLRSIYDINNEASIVICIFSRRRMKGMKIRLISKFMLIYEGLATRQGGY
jgi:hypothetical protein